MDRMKAFEKSWAERHDLPVDSLAQHRHADGSGYRLPELAKHYRTWCAVFDALEMENQRVVPVGECL